MDSKEHQLGAALREIVALNKLKAQMADATGAPYDILAGGYRDRWDALVATARAILAASGSQEQRSTECQSPDLASSVQSDLRLAAQIRNLVIEECAVICERMAEDRDGDAALTTAAAAIRAAKEQG